MSFSYLATLIYRLGNMVKVVYLKRYFDTDQHIRNRYESDNVDGVDSKRLNNICRARSMVLAYGFCNPWDYMVTFTLNPAKYNRFDLDTWQKDFSQWIRNYRKSSGFDFKYILIPELHEDGAWHMHGLVSGVPLYALEEFKLGIHPLKLCTGEFKWHKVITEKFGFNSFGIIRCQEAAVKYITKYIRKCMYDTTMELGAHLYYVSRGLNKPELISSGYAAVPLTAVDHENEFYCVSWIEPSEVDGLISELR